MIPCAEPRGNSGFFLPSFGLQTATKSTRRKEPILSAIPVDSFRVLYAFNRQSDKADHISGLS